MRVADVMSHRPLMIDAFDTVEVAAQLMRAQVIGTLPVVEQGELVGVVTDRDLVLRCMAPGEKPWETFVREVMTPNPATCRAEEPLLDAIERMIARRVRRLIVVDDEGVAGILSVDDLVLSHDTQPMVFMVLEKAAQMHGGELEGEAPAEKEAPVPGEL